MLAVVHNLTYWMLPEFLCSLHTHIHTSVCVLKIYK